MVRAHEWQFDGLVGPTHNYSGLAHGNLAAQHNAGNVSNPKAAALQGLEKMKFVSSLGVKQAFLPPHFRPFLPELNRLGFSGGIGAMLQQAADYSPSLLAALYSSSFMWTANAATIAPSCDTADGKLHITPANMTSHYHRHIEAEHSYDILTKIFHNQKYFSVHKPLFPNAVFGDEGAANHMIVNHYNGDKAVHIFVYGEDKKNQNKPEKYPARQQRMASEAIARLHQLDLENCMFIQQAPEAIDQGVFHNDVIAMNATRRMVVHEHAFTPADQSRMRAFAARQQELRYREITAKELPMTDAVASYLFNSQLLDLGSDRFVLLAPTEAEQNQRARETLQALQDEGLLSEVYHLDLRESMRNGGGPACLRLRVAMTEEEAAAIHPGIVLTEARYQALKQWVEKHYRDRLHPDDLRDPAFVGELQEAYCALEEICEMPGLYQKWSS